MKVSELKKQLSKLMNPKKQTIPSMEHILLKGGWMSTTNLETTTKVKVPFEGEFTTDYKNLKKLVSKLPKNDTVEFYAKSKMVTVTDWDGNKSVSEEVEKQEIFLNCGKADISLGISKEDEFPKLLDDFEEYREIGVFNKSDIDKLKKAVKFSSNDELRPIMCGVYVDGESGNYVATNAHLVWIEKARSLEKNFVMPKDSISNIEPGKLYVREKDDKTSENYAVVSDDYVCIFRAVEGKFPNYKSVFPTPEKSFTSDREQTLKALEMMKVLGCIIVECSGNLVGHSELDYDGYVDDKITPAMTYESDWNFEEPTGFSLEYLLSLIKELEEDTVKVEYVNPSTGVLLNGQLLMSRMLKKSQI